MGGLGTMATAVSNVACDFHRAFKSGVVVSILLPNQGSVNSDKLSSSDPSLLHESEAERT